MKKATVTINKNIVLKRVDELTYKRTDGVMSDQSLQLKNAITSDSEEALDKSLLNMFMEGRDGCLRGKLAFCLISEDNSDELTASNEVDEGEDFTYRLNVPDHFNGDVVKALAQKINGYLIDAVAFDWYSKQGLTYSVNATELEEILADIAIMLRKPFVKRPLQPFGPAR